MTEELGRLLKALNYYPGRPTHSRITHCHCRIVCETRVQDASKIKQGHPTHECTLETKVLATYCRLFQISSIHKATTYTLLIIPLYIIQSCNSHLSKHPSDLKQYGTQEKTPFSSTVFHALSHGVIRFVASVSSKNHLLAG